MKENQKDYRWLDEIREEMQDFEAKIPANGWKRVSLSLAQHSNSAIGKRWIGIAASILICAILGGGYYFFGDKTTAVYEEPIVTQKTMEEEPQTTPAGEDSLQPSASPRTFKDLKIAAAGNEELKREETTEQMQENLAEAVNTEPGTEILQQRNDAISSIPNREEEKVLLAMNNTGCQYKEGSDWSFGLHVGGNGFSSNNEMSSGPQYMDDTAIGGHDGSNTQVKSDEIIGSGNHASWSFGISADRQVLPRTTLETGIVFTMLTSDVEMKFAGIRRQRIQYLGIPLKQNYLITGGDQCQLYAGAGIMLEHSLSARRGGERVDVKPWQWSSNLSVGGQFHISSHIMLYLEPGVNWYFNADPSVPSLRSESPLYFNLRGGIRITHE